MSGSLRRSILYGWAQTLLFFGLNRAALRAFQEVVREEPGRGEAWSVLGYLHAQRGEMSEAVPAFEKASPTFGDVFAWGMTSCLGETERSQEKPRDIRAAGAAPIVVVGTTRDPATPYAWAESLASQLESGVLVSRDGDGHTGYNAGNDCVDEAIEAYLVDGTAPEDGLSC